MFKLKTNKTLDDILLGFTSTIEALQDLAQRNTTRVIENNQRITELAAENEALNDESRKAMKVSNKLSALLDE